MKNFKQLNYLIIMSNIIKYFFPPKNSLEIIIYNCLELHYQSLCDRTPMTSGYSYDGMNILSHTFIDNYKTSFYIKIFNNIDNLIYKESIDECCVCFENSKTRLKCCKQILCKSCLIKIRNKDENNFNCPNCRKNLNDDFIHYHFNSEFLHDYFTIILKCNKVKKIKSFINNQND